MKAEGIRIPSQRIAIKNGELFTDRDTIHLVADGRYKRTQFDFAGEEELENAKNNIIGKWAFAVI